MEKILGVDFSGSKHPAKKIALAELETKDVLTLKKVYLLSDLKPLENPYALLVSIIAEFPIAGLDAPLGLPFHSIGVDSYEELLKRFSDKFESAEQLYVHGKNFKKEPKREAEMVAGVPFSAYNLRLYRQTWNAIGQVARPLVWEHNFSVAGAMNRKNKLLLEACPASYWKKIARLNASYKGKSTALLKERENKLNYLINKEQLCVLKGQKEKIIQNAEGDLLDAVTCAIIAKYARVKGANIGKTGEPGVFYGAEKK